MCSLGWVPIIFPLICFTTVVIAIPGLVLAVVVEEAPGEGRGGQGLPSGGKNEDQDVHDKGQGHEYHLFKNRQL